MPYPLLVLAQLIGLLLIPLGLPGLWVQVLALAGYAWWSDFATVGWWAILVVALLAAGAEVVEFVLGGKYAERYGGSRRAAWGAILGGLVGAVIGVPVFLIGSVIGAFIGAFVGAALLELTVSREGQQPGWRGAVRVGWGAFLGRLVAVVIKSSVGVAIAAIALFVALR
jgi:uncharacterized protein